MMGEVRDETTLTTSDIAFLSTRVSLSIRRTIAPFDSAKPDATALRFPLFHLFRTLS